MDADTYFDVTSPPAHLDESISKVQDFVEFNLNRGKRIALVTSGGTTVPLEKQTVRFLDNFSAGTRGACSAEYFIQAGYAVLFLHRQFSLEPFTRHYTHSKNCFLDFLEEAPSTTEQDEDGKEKTLVVSEPYRQTLLRVWRQYKDAKKDRMLLSIDFVTVKDYLFLLRGITNVLKSGGAHVLLYLAAAVSDFFIPQEKMVEHKIQSSGDGLVLSLEPVPKIIRPLVKQWAKDTFVVSFKLETDPDMLVPKSRAALQRYGHQLVIGNILSTRKQVVEIIKPESEAEIRLTDEELAKMEIEERIIKFLVKEHDAWIDKHRG